MHIPRVSLKKTVSVITKPFNIAPVAFITAGVGKTMKDYADAPEERKQRVLLKDSSMLLGSVLAFALVAPLSKKLCNAKVFSKLTKICKKAVKSLCNNNFKETKIINETKKVVKHTERIINEASASTINTFAGIFGAVGANELMHKYVFSKKSFIKEKKITPNLSEGEQVASETQAVSTEQKQIFQNPKKGYFKVTNVFEKFDYTTPKAVKEASDRIWSTMSDVPDMKLLSAPMIALTGFSIANTKGYEGKLKKTTYELIANTFIPTAFITAVSIAVENKKALIKYPSLFVGLLAGSMAGKFGAEKVNKCIIKKFGTVDEKHTL